jgi:hypothetical protein
MKLLGITRVGFDITDQLVNRFSAFMRHWRKNYSTMRQYISYSDFRNAYNSVWRKVLYNILKEFQLFIKSLRLIEMCLNKTYNKVRIGKPLSDNFPIQNGIKEDALSPLRFSFDLKDAVRKVQEIQLLA